MNLCTRVSILMPTSITPSAPSIRLVKTSLDSILTQWPLYESQIIIHCDLPKDPQPNEYKYLFNLQKWARHSDLNILILNTIHGGLKKGYIKLINKAQTPFILFWEHDWVFVMGHTPDLKKLLNVFDKYNFVNYIRFNKRSNRIIGWDTRLKTEPRIKEIELLKTWNISNNPHLARTNVVRNEWLPYLRRDKKRTSYGRMSGPWGVEDAYNKYVQLQEKRLGYERAHEKWGTYLYGALGHDPVVQHIDGKRY